MDDMTVSRRFDRPHSQPVVEDWEVEEVLNDFLLANPVPGVAASLFTEAGIVAQAGRGVTSIEAPDLEMTPRTAGQVYSLSKVMTGTAFSVLAARGRVNLHEPIARHLPDVPGRERFEATTLRHLLSHSAGLVRGPVPFSSATVGKGPLEKYVLSACLGATRFAEPGEVFGYSGIGIVIAGYVLERITGVPFTQAMHESLFVPAGMRRTTMDPAIASTFPLSRQHELTESGDLVVRHTFDSFPMVLPSLGAFSCAEDLARLGMVHLRGDPGAAGRPLLTERATADLHAPHVDVGLDIVRAYGLGIATGPRFGKAMSVGHEGHYRGSWAKLQLIPEQGIGVAWMDNRGEAPEHLLRRQHYFDRLMHLLGAGPRSWRRAEEIGDLDVPSAVGTYRRSRGRSIEVTLESSGLCASDGVTTVNYEHLTGRVFVASDDARNIPARIPWAPDGDSTRSSLCVVGPAQAPTHILLNGLPYQRSSPEELH